MRSCWTALHLVMLCCQKNKTQKTYNEQKKRKKKQLLTIKCIGSETHFCYSAILTLCLYKVMEQYPNNNVSKWKVCFFITQKHRYKYKYNMNIPNPAAWPYSKVNLITAWRSQTWEHQFYPSVKGLMSQCQWDCGQSVTWYAFSFRGSVYNFAWSAI